MSAPDSLPDLLGPYRIVRLLGDGASGRVLLAEQSQPARPVALKLLRGVAAGAQGLARFEREAKVLAQLEHPGIARLYAADTADTASGPAPYLAMEYVPGPDLVQYARPLPLRERMALLVQVCRAVHFAHTRGVIHRDLKPANILVDALGAPKVLDFGIARVLDPEAETQLTRLGEVLGTLPYMSWEQLGGEAAALDPRSDVYALGVIGYELVAQARPYPPLSTPSLTAVLAQRRKEVPRRLGERQPEARGDLDTIIHKAMAFEARDRYESAAELAGDLQRWLEHRPIEARPPTATYVLSRFVRRHRALSVTAGLALALLLAATGVSLHFAQAEKAARARAEARSAELAAVNRLLEDTLGAANPENNTPGSARTLLEVLSQGETTLQRDRSVPPGVAAQVFKTLGSTWHGLEQYDRAAAALDQAQSALARLPADDPSAGLLALEVAALKGIVQVARGETGPGEAQLKAVLAKLPPATGEAQALRMAVYGRYADSLLGRAAFDEVIALLQDVVRESRETLGAAHVHTLFNRGRFAYARRLSGDPRGAETELAVLLPQVQATFGPDNGLTLLLQGEQALCWLQTERYVEAAAGFRALLARNLTLYGESGQSTMASRGNLVNALVQLKQFDEARVLAEQNYRLVMSRFGVAHFETHMAGRNYARVLEDAGAAAEAERLYRAAVRGLRVAGGENHPEAFRAVNDLGVFLVLQQRAPEAVELYAEMHPRAVRAFGLDSANTVAWDANWGRALHAAGRHAEAVTVLERVIPGLERHYGAESSRTVKARERLAASRAALAS